MKKFLALVLAFVVVCSFSVVAFAAGSPTPYDPGTYYTPTGTDKETKGPQLFVDEKEIDGDIIDITDADKLEDSDKEAFLQAFEAAKERANSKGKVLKYMFWVPAAGVELAEGQTADLKFSCEGTGIFVTSNEEEVVVEANEGIEYTAKLTELPAAVAVFVDAEA